VAWAYTSRGLHYCRAVGEDLPYDGGVQ
jgi:hypothetical protein